MACDCSRKVADDSISWGHFELQSCAGCLLIFHDPELQEFLKYFWSHSNLLCWWTFNLMVVFVVCTTEVCFTQRGMYLHHKFKVLKCFSSQLSVSFDAYLFLHALFVWQIPAHWMTGSTRDVIHNLRGVVWYLNTFEGIQHLGGFNVFLSRN